MGGNPGAVPNGTIAAIQMPPTERVEDLRVIEQALIFPQIPGSRNWQDLFTKIFFDHYSTTELGVVVTTCLKRKEEGFLPIEIMDIFREGQRLNACCK